MKRGSGTGNPHKPVIQHWKFKAHQPQQRNAPTRPTSSQVPAPVFVPTEQPPQQPAPPEAPPAPRGSEPWLDHWQDAGAGYYSPQQRPTTGFYLPDHGGYLWDAKATSSPVMQATPRARGQGHQRRHSAPNVPLQSFVHHWKLDGKQSSSPRMCGPTYPPPPVQVRRAGPGPRSPSVGASQVLIGPAPAYTQPAPEPMTTSAPPSDDVNVGSNVESAAPTGGRTIRTKAVAVFHQYLPPEAKGEAVKNRTIMSPRSHPYKDGRREQPTTSDMKPWPKRGTSPLRTSASPIPEAQRMRPISEQERYEYASPHTGMPQVGYDPYPDTQFPSPMAHPMASPASYYDYYQHESHSHATPPPYAYSTSTPYDLSAPAIVASSGAVSDPRSQGYQTQWYQSPTTTAHPYSPHPSEPPALHLPSPHHYATYPVDPQAPYAYTQWPQEPLAPQPSPGTGRNLAFQMLLDSVEHQLKLDEKEEQEKQLAAQESQPPPPSSMHVEETSHGAEAARHEVPTMVQPTHTRTVDVSMDSAARSESAWQEPVRASSESTSLHADCQKEDSGSDTVSE